jgi:pantoate--beta-alanine ligase
VLTTAAEIFHAVQALRSAGQTVGLVPTMGALHAGHLSLLEAARRDCDRTVVTIFVNPTQFGPGEDLARYPRNLAADLEALTQTGVDLVFAPAAEEIYRPGHSTFVRPPDVAQPLEGRCRPGHFQGVATVVLKLLLLAPAHAAYFGEKDFQQLLVIRRMVADLNVPTAVRGCPTVRDADGLAMSSRNAYLSPAERQRALAIPRCLELAFDWYQAGQRDSAAIAAGMRQVLADAGLDRIDYVALADAETLAEATQLGPSSVALVAAHVGATRLIDNRRLG